MAQQVGKSPPPAATTTFQVVVLSKLAKGWVAPLLRLVAFLATVTATVVMATNKDTESFAVATIGSTSIKITLTAKFQHTPAFVFFVIANALASFHSLLMLAVNLVSNNYDFKGLRFIIIAILDMMIVALVAGGATAAGFMGELGRNGNSHARWNKICDKFDTFCERGSAAILASFIGLVFLIIVNIISIAKLAKRNCAKNYVDIIP